MWCIIREQYDCIGFRHVDIIEFFEYIKYDVSKWEMEEDRRDFMMALFDNRIDKLIALYD